MMKRKVKKPNPYDKWQRYPKEVARRSGCKVSWNYYKTLEEAKVCSKAAYENSFIAEAEGYDFGYQAPGAIRQVTEPGLVLDARGGIRRGGEGTPVTGLYEVCLP